VPTKCLATDVSEKIAKFSVVGKYLDHSRGTFVRHVAMANSSTDVRHNAAIPVWHMGPPLVAGEVSSAAVGITGATCAAHLAGTVSLDAQDIEGIETWLAEVDKEDRPSGRRHLLKQYIAHPPMGWRTAENASRLYRVFSCVGFVLECYKSINIHIIDGSCSESLPEIDLETLKEAYGHHVGEDKYRTELGLDGNGPWRVLLPGYLFHSLERSSEVIRAQPHVPKSVLEKEYPLTAVVTGEASP
jgi:hypothetical protein